MTIKLNPDLNFVREVCSKITKNNGHCPCAIILNDDNICMCKEFREKDTPGYCNCKLYYKY